MNVQNKSIQLINFYYFVVKYKTNGINHINIHRMRFEIRVLLLEGNFYLEQIICFKFRVYSGKTKRQLDSFATFLNTRRVK